MGLTKQVLRRPVTTILVVLCLIVFGLNSILGSKIELVPDMEMPMLVISAVYPGASPDDVEELVVKVIEDEVGTLSGVDSITSVSNENFGIVLLQYEYGSNMDKAYNDLKKKIDGLAGDLPDDVDVPTIFEMDINDTPSVTMAVNNDHVENLYDYTQDKLIPELEKLSSVASVDVSGGQETYIRVELIPEKLSQYHLSMSAVAGAIGSADFTMPVGSTIVGGKELSVSADVDFDTMERLREIPIVMGNGNIIYMKDVANIYKTLEDKTGIGRYNGRDTIAVSVKKNQDSSDMEVSRDVTKVIDAMKAEDPNLEVAVVMDYSDQIKDSLSSVFQTMIMAVIVAMIVIWLFFGDIKASVIVGTSIPISILAALIMMFAMGFSLNVITLSSLVLAVGMMVDNSIVVLESCFRTTNKGGFVEARRAAVDGTATVLQSIIGGTATTCVVFLPLATITGMSGQLFRPLGFTIVFCMIASLISAMTIVPLCYLFYLPKEREHTPASGIMSFLQKSYRSGIRKILNKKITVMLTAVLLLVLSLMMASQLKTDLMPTGDEGVIAVTIETEPGLTIERVDEILQRVETYVTSDTDVESYLLSMGSSGLSMNMGSGATLTAYLEDERVRETDDIVKEWKRELQTWPDCTISVEASSSTGLSMAATGDDQVDYILVSTQYDELKAASDQIVKELQARDEITYVHSTLENSAPLVKISVDPVKASAEGLSPIQVARQVYTMLSGTEATTINISGQDISVKVEYPEDEYRTIDQLQGIVLPTAAGGSVALSDIATIGFKDSPMSITKTDKQYQVTITGQLTDLADSSTDKLLENEVIGRYLNATIQLKKNTMDEMMEEEFGSLGNAIGIAVFLVFVVMAAQFESPKFSLMVMLTIPFALIGSFGLLWFADCAISMPSLLGFLVLVGTVVNNGILYVDTVNQYRNEMDLDTALVEAGATRMRPMFMTTLTTIVAMIPMALAYGNSGEMLQGLALVDLGGLIASTVMSLLMLPTFYKIMNGKQKKNVEFE